MAQFTARAPAEKNFEFKTLFQVLQKIVPFSWTRKYNLRAIHRIRPTRLAFFKNIVHGVSPKTYTTSFVYQMDFLKLFLEDIKVCGA